MIESVIRWSVGNRFFVLLATLLLLGWGAWSLKNTPGRCDTGPVRCAGNRQDQLPRPGAAGGRRTRSPIR